MWGLIASRWSLPNVLTFFLISKSEITKSFSQLLAMDVSAQKTMKDAAKCDKHCEWQNLANLWNSERILHPGACSRVRLVQGVFTFMLHSSW